MEKKGYQEGKCPICGSRDLEYSSVELETGFLYYPVTCKKCGGTGREYYNIEFTDIVMEDNKEQEYKDFKRCGD